MLSMNECSLGEDGAIYIAQGLSENKTLQKISLVSNKFGDEGIMEFARRMQDPGLKIASLDLSSNYISDASGQLLGEAFVKNRSITNLSLRDNSLNDCTANKFLSSIYGNGVVQDIDFSDNFISVKIIGKLKSHFLMN